MASKTHVDNTVNERRLRPIYGTYNFVDHEIQFYGIRRVCSRLSVRSYPRDPRMTRLYNDTQVNEASLDFRLAG